MERILWLCKITVTDIPKINCKPSNQRWIFFCQFDFTYEVIRTHDSGQLFAGWRTTMEFGYFWGWTVIGVKVGIYYEIGPQSPSLESQGGRKATDGNVNWMFQVENRGSLPQELFNKYAAIKDPAAHTARMPSAHYKLWDTSTLSSPTVNAVVPQRLALLSLSKENKLASYAISKLWTTHRLSGSILRHCHLRFCRHINSGSSHWVHNIATQHLPHSLHEVHDWVGQVDCRWRGAGTKLTANSIRSADAWIPASASARTSAGARSTPAPPSPGARWGWCCICSGGRRTALFGPLHFHFILGIFFQGLLFMSNQTLMGKKLKIYALLKVLKYCKLG